MSVRTARSRQLPMSWVHRWQRVSAAATRVLTGRDHHQGAMVPDDPPDIAPSAGAAPGRCAEYAVTPGTGWAGRDEPSEAEARDLALAGMAHDLRTPLTAVRVHAQMLMRATRVASAIDLPAVTEHLTAIDDAVTEIDGLIDDMLDLAALRHGCLPRPQCAPTDLAALVQDVIARLARADPGEHMVLVEGETALGGSWDAGQLVRLVSNLLTNARKFSPAARPITVQLTHALHGDRRWAVLTVRDEGPGIPSADLPHVFAPFARGSNVVGQVSGRGLGLFTVQQIAERHGGRIAIRSWPGAGTEVIVELPLEAEPEPASSRGGGRTP